MKKTITICALALTLVGATVVGVTQAQAASGSLPLETYAPKIHKQVKDSNGSPITNWDYTEHPFTFTIASKGGAPLPSNTTATTDANGDVTWGSVDYTEPGEYVYEITEQQGDDPDITYDTSQHTLKVTVEASQPPTK